MAGPLPDAQKFDSIVGSILRKAQTVVPGQRVAVFGEMVALLTEKGNFDGAIRLEFVKLGHGVPLGERE